MAAPDTMRCSVLLRLAHPFSDNRTIKSKPTFISLFPANGMDCWCDATVSPRSLARSVASGDQNKHMLAGGGAVLAADWGAFIQVQSMRRTRGMAPATA